jgi:hypothetical protein
MDHMKQGRSLVEIAQELMRRKETTKDFIAPQGAIEAKVVEGQVVLEGLNGEPKQITPYAHRQIADHLGIPAKYYDRMAEKEPALLAENVNTWLRKDGQEKRMVRTLDNRVRAFLSPKYRPLDNFELAEAVLPVLRDRGVEIMSSELTETRMYIKGILPSLSDELPEGMTWGRDHHMVGRTGRLVASVVISNSEVGAGTLRIEPSVFTTWCTNLAIITQSAMRKYHVGRGHEAGEDLELFRDDTRKADDAAFWLKVRDVTQAAFAEDKWKAAIEQIRSAAKEAIESTENLPKVVEVAVKRLALPESTAPSILGHLAAGGDLSKWGLSSAITAAANTFSDYEGATELERAGGKVLALEGRDWEVIARAAA